MCDLIDLSSPDPRKLQGISKLASPLIPGPPTPTEKPNDIDFISDNKRSSLDNNPFDKLFKETAEYVSKKNDPFETVMEKAQQNNFRKDSQRGSKHREDFTPKRRRHTEVLRMNKTMDEPLLQGILNKNFQLSRCQNVENNDINTNGCFSLANNNNKDGDLNRDENSSPYGNPDIVIFPPSSPGNSSVLNHSAMNDSLLEDNCRSVENAQVFTSSENEKEIFTPEMKAASLKSSKHRRSLSQGTKFPKELSEIEKESIIRPRSKSTVDTLKVISKSRGSSASSIETNLDFANNAFMETDSETNTESLDLSRISATPKSGHSSSTFLCSYGSKNRAFISPSEFSSNKIYGSTSSAKTSFDLSSISKSTGTANLLVKTPLKNPVRIADLEVRLEKIKLQSNGSIGGLPLYSPNRKVQNFLRSGDAESGIIAGLGSFKEMDAKLIETDGFEAEECDLGNCSSDSVFVESNNVDYPIFREAKILARTFDELAQHSTSASFSSGDDLLYSRPRWNFDVLPVSDDDEPPVVDNLIELPVSPLKNETDARSAPTEEKEENENEKMTESKVSEGIKDLETEFIEQDNVKNKVLAATLLLDLEKLVHRENNPEAITLLENLEKVLGVKYESNAQLLATCLQETNNLSKSPKKSFGKIVLNENIKNESLEKSDEDNNDTGLPSSVKTPKILNDDSLKLNLNLETAVNKNEKSILANISSENKESSLEKSQDIKKDFENEKKEISVNQTEALELITNLSKILGGPNNDSSPLSLLTNLRQVLNLATNQLNFENSQTIKSQSQETRNKLNSENSLSQKKPIAKGKAPPIKVARKKSIDSSTKVQSNASSSIKRSMSFGSAQRSIALIASMAKEKAKPNSKTFKKTLSCDAVPKPDKLEKAASTAPEMGRSRAPSLGATGKYKLKKKPETEIIQGKKGPLKALLPVGNMQRRGSMSSKIAPISLSRTPPKSSIVVSANFQSATSSTPNPKIELVANKKSPKTKPVASSTPDGSGSKARRMRLQFSKNNTKPKFSCNISPVTPLPTQSINGDANSSKGSSKNLRHNKTLSPPKRRSSQEVLALNTTESSIPKYSPISGFSRKNSRETVKSPDNSGSPKTSATKSRTPKKSSFFLHKGESQIPQSPLKTMNNQNSKFKPFNLISKLRRGSNGSNVSDKENCA